ncbi:MAG: EAL domain-containing protein [Inhella sp.]|jgi:diguanylate cyclase (GGDEF)-like protein/PAS domain S-box-containing protein|uniref:sensor domain-containing protein n=2 Tax=Inhella sp. TaxID=1921806 RepID=UPI00391DE950
MSDADAIRASLPDFFRSLVQALPDLVWIKDPNGVYLACNTRFEALYGAPEAEIVGKTDDDFVPPERAAFFRLHDQAAIAADRTQVLIETLRFASDGHEEHLQTIKTPMRDAQGRLVGVLGIARDLTDQLNLQDELERSLSRLRQAERIAKQGSWELDHHHRTLTWSEQAHRIIGTDTGSTSPAYADFLERVHPDDRPRVQACFEASRRDGAPYRSQHRILRLDGDVRHVQEHGQHFDGDSGPAQSTVGIVQDVTERVLQDRALLERQALFSAVVEQSSDSFAVVDPGTGRFVEFNDSAPRNLGFTRAEFTALCMADIEADADAASQALRLAAMCGEQPVRFDTQHRHRDGGVREVQMSGRGIEVHGQRLIAAIWRDVTESRHAEQAIHRLSYYDGLTGLPNRHLLGDRVVQLLKRVTAAEPAALLIVNLDRFHAINDALGRAVGDEVLREAARRLQTLPLHAASVMHLGADEFVLLLDDERGRDAAETGAQALRLAHATLRALQQPMHVNEHSMELRVSVGIALMPSGPHDHFSDVMRRADTALHRAKRASVQRVAFFDEGMGDAARQQFHVEQALREAIPAQQLRLFLQPQVDVRGRLVAAEALVRWQRPQHGLVAPGEFIPVAEDSGLIVDLDRWMLGQVADLTRRLREAGRPTRIAVNISPLHFHSPDFVSWLQACLLRHRALPEDLMLEVTETLVIENLTEVIDKMHSLGELGICFSMDDFGTGYSSLAHLKRLPIHELKIDRSFVQDAVGDADSVALISTILAVAHHMNLEVVAEGIETAQQVALFAGLAPQVRLQGYFFARPEPEAVWWQRWVT